MSTDKVEQLSIEDFFSKPRGFILLVLLGVVAKYALGGQVLDLVGHLLIFLGSLKLVYYLRDTSYSGLNNWVATMALLVVIFIGIQVIAIQIVANILHISPLLK